MIDPQAIGMTAEPRRRTWSVDDTMLYALAVGAGTADLDLTTENTADVAFLSLPSFGAVLGGGLGDLRHRVGTWPPGSVVHGTQLIELARPLPTQGEIEIVAAIAAIEDKGSGALVEVESRGVDIVTGEELFISTTGLFIRGEGGFSGAGNHAKGLPAGEIPERAPDFTVSSRTREDQSLLYRLCGDHNPLHSDPSFALRAGFARPILHGLCTWGFAARMLGRSALAGRFDRIAAFGGRFRAPVTPGDVLTVEAWRTSDRDLRFRVRVDDRVVIDRGILREFDR